MLDEALLVADSIMVFMLSGLKSKKFLLSQGAYYILMGPGKSIGHFPEFSSLGLDTTGAGRFESVSKAAISESENRSWCD